MKSEEQSVSLWRISVKKQKANQPQVIESLFFVTQISWIRLSLDFGENYKKALLAIIISQKGNNQDSLTSAT
jgi:hypothetical protein